MATKLTLKLDEPVIEQAKKYAKANNISLSKLIENYLRAVTSRRSKKMEVSPLVKSLTGVIDLPEEENKKAYSDFLNKKYR